MLLLYHYSTMYDLGTRCKYCCSYCLRYVQFAKADYDIKKSCDHSLHMHRSNYSHSPMQKPSPSIGVLSGNSTKSPSLISKRSSSVFAVLYPSWMVSNGWRPMDVEGMATHAMYSYPHHPSQAAGRGTRSYRLCSSPFPLIRLKTSTAPSEFGTQTKPIVINAY